MNTNQFRVVEHYSYDMIGTFLYERRNINGEDVDRLYNALIKSHVINVYRCRMYLFPDYQFNAKEYAQR